MISLKRLKNPSRLPKIRDRIRPIKLNKGPRPKRLRKMPGRKRKEGHTKENKTDEKVKTVATLQRKLISLRPQKTKRRNDAITRALKGTSLSSLAITVIRKINSPGIAPSQKTGCSFIRKLMLVLRRQRPYRRCFAFDIKSDFRNSNKLKFQSTLVARSMQ